MRKEKLILQCKQMQKPSRAKLLPKDRLNGSSGSRKFAVNLCRISEKDRMQQYQTIIPVAPFSDEPYGKSSAQLQNCGNSPNGLLHQS